MILKEGVTLAGLDLRMRPVLLAAESIWEDLGQELVITSGLEGTHTAGSLHYYGLALDLRTRYFNLETRRVATQRLAEELGSSFDVIDSITHIHVEYDV